MTKNIIIAVMALGIIGLTAAFVLNKDKHKRHQHLPNHQEEQVHDKHNAHKEAHSQSGHHGKANEYMHQRGSVEQLSKSFDSSERDAYQKPEQVLDYLGDITGKTIVDIGSGSGYFSMKLADKGAHVIAADVSDEFQNIIKEKIETNGIENIELRKIEYDDPLLKPQEVDIAFIVNTYHHIEQRSDYFAKVKQGLKEDGVLVVIDFFKSEVPVGPPTDHKIAMDVVIDELKKAGFTHFEVDVNLLPYQFIIKAK